MFRTKFTKKIPIQESFTWPILTIIVLLFFIVIMGLFVVSRTKEQGKIITVGRESISVSVADTVAEREKGLGDRENLSQNQGMLFDFKTDDIWKIWMLHMHFPLDIAWLDASGKVVYIKTDITPETFPSVFIPELASRYVLEVNAGTFERSGLRVGDTVRL